MTEDHSDKSTAAEDPNKASHHPFRDNIEVVVFAIVMALGLKVFAVEAYQIPTGSMQPTLMGTELLDAATQVPDGAIHDRVLVDKLTYHFRDPERWEVVVFRYPLVIHNNYVKRLVGMPGEWLKIENGDLFAHKETEDEFRILRKPRKLQDRLWKKVFPLPDEADRPWSAWTGSGGWAVDEPGAGRLLGRATVEFNRSIRDDYRDGYPDSIRARIPTVGAGALSRNLVGDLRVQFEAGAEPGSQPLQLRMQCGVFTLDLGIPGPEGGQLWLELPGGQRWVEELGAWTGRIRGTLAWWDHHWLLEIESSGGSIKQSGDIEVEPRAISRNGVTFATTEGDWHLSAPRIDRDIHYLPPIHGAAALFEIPEGEYFMMGDNTQNSLDGRDWEARIFQFDPPVHGRSKLRGDSMEQGPDDFLVNPRWNRRRDVMTFRDEFGKLYTVPRESIAKDDRVAWPTVPREYVVGKAILVFLPVPPFAPVVRILTVL